MARHRAPGPRGLVRAGALPVPLQVHVGVCCADVRESGADGDAVWDRECGERVGEAGGLSRYVWRFEGVL